MFCEVQSAVMIGLECRFIRVEVDVSDGLPVFEMVGYLAGEVREARERVRAALRNCGRALPAKRITVNLSPGDVRKSGAAFDLPIAIALLAALGVFPEQTMRELNRTLVMGELGLNGEVKPVNGILPITAAMDENVFVRCVLPEKNRLEGVIGTKVPCFGVQTLEDAVAFFQKNDKGEPPQIDAERLFTGGGRQEKQPDFAEIVGQESVKRAALIAAAGFHNLLMIGPPGAGKTMIARRIPGIMPPLSREEGLALSKIYSVAGLLPADRPLITKRPFRAPHHQITAGALIGGGKNPRPGEVTLAHRSVLFLDELSEFSKPVLDMLRQPLEDKKVCLSRLSGCFEYPADFMLVAAMNPCACGYYPDRNRCRCSNQEIQKYLSRISRPLLDRIDICVETPKVDYAQLSGEAKGGQAENSAKMRAQVELAVERQKRRYAGTPFQFNADLSAGAVSEFCPLCREVQELLKKAYVKLDLSARGYHRLIRVARTIADLEQSEEILPAHMAEAISYRGISKAFWE